MALIPVGSSRVPFSLSTLIANENIRTRQQALINATNEVSTQKRINLPSDDPYGAVRASILQSLKDSKSQYLLNVKSTTTNLSEVDTSLSTVRQAIDDSRVIGLRGAQNTVTSDERAADAKQVDSIIDSVLRAANKTYNDQYLFAGEKLGVTPFVRDGKYIVFNGDTKTLKSQSSDTTPIDFNISGNSAIGTDSTGGKGTIDLNPSLTSATRLSLLRGGAGISKGAFQLNTGSGTVTVDISSADSIGDVLSQINAAAGAGTASISPSGAGIRLSGTGPITAADISGGTVARDLGIRVTGASSPIDGGDLNPKLDPTTTVSALNFASPLGTLQINNGPYSASIDLSSATSVEQILNKINDAGARVRAEINDSGTAIDVVNVLSGSALTITGTTAQTLGVSTTSASVKLADLNDYGGVNTNSGADLYVVARDGSKFQIDLDSSTFTDKTIGGFLNYLSASTGGKVVGTIGQSGAIVLQDTTGGTGNLIVTNISASPSASDLGIDTGKAGVSSTSFVGVNKYGARVKGVFDTLLRIREGLANNDVRAISQGTSQLDADSSRTLQASTSVGAQLQNLQQTQDRLTDEIATVTSETSQTVDSDLSESITRLLQEQSALQAALSSTGRLLQRSLLDFL